MPAYYNIPVSLLNSCQGEKVVIRSRDAGELSRHLSRMDLDKVVNLQLLSLRHDPAEVSRLPEHLGVNLVIEEVNSEFPLLYRYVDLVNSRPMLVTVPAEPGCANAVKVAVSIGFPVRLQIGQPDEQVWQELADIRDYYLHQATVCQPIEFFHSLLLSYYLDSPVTLWAIQEEDPSISRYINDDGTWSVPSRTMGEDRLDPDRFVGAFRGKLLARGAQCVACSFFDRCSGYFKLPDPAFDCHNAWALLEGIRQAAGELKEYRTQGGVSKGRNR